ncbi:MAG: methylmalonyl-CoA mutase [Deltaproteobacteria bacterium]|nr:methylmalonyl-CoA mutase [Deltaproteobacteria bacterium]
MREKTRHWQENVYGCHKERLEKFESLSGLPIKALYTPEDLSGTDYLRDLGYPGEAPFVRGVYPTMYRGRTWTLRQLAGYGPAEETNLRYKFLLDQGATGINGVFDYPTLRGFDSTDPLARADVGLGGVAIDTLDDMRILFDGIPIDQVSASLVTCNPLCNISLQSMYFANARMRDIPFTNLAGTSQNDFLMETAITIAPEVLPPEFSFKLCCDAIEFCARHVPHWNPVSYTGYNYRESGCTAVQEVAFVMANAMACIEELVSRGLDVDTFAPRLSFFLSSYNDFFEEIAKCRAARRLWARIMEKRFGAKNPKSLAFRFHVQTAGVALTAQQPLNNVSRAAYHGLAAALGGAQSIHIDGYDEALGIPTELASLTALRTSQILQLETRVTHTIDPLGGSYFVESLTNRLEEEIERLLNEIDGLGGIVKATEIGWVHKEISNSAYQYQQDIETGAMPIVGVNCFQMEEEELPVEIFQVPETLEIQTAKLKKIKAERSEAEVQKALDAIARCCDARENLMEVIVDVVESRVTEGEISQAIKKVYGTWETPLF